MFKSIVITTEKIRNSNRQNDLSDNLDDIFSPDLDSVSTSPVFEIIQRKNIDLSKKVGYSEFFAGTK